MIGKHLSAPRDNDANFFVKELVAMVWKGPDAKGWQDHKFMNPASRSLGRTSRTCA